ncbi:longevity-assurance family protein [Entamoeba histolytica HM-3:IMSS]|uniref:Longevity-assurance family protein n=1 Tax=Entamoeba histolytica HM-3:IMSS TaxID=885315 RepID=M7WDN6_ENTHI|nr:longevity-assurance family protein [Entamoeba histolytica HM-3:IMSS]
MFSSKMPKLNGICDKSFILQIALIIPFVLICLPSSISRRSDFGDNVPSIVDLIPSIGFLIVISFLREVLACNVFIKLGDKYIPRKPEWTDEFRKFRVERFGLTLFKTMYYFIITPLGIYLFRHEDWMPSALFGVGKSDLNALWEDFPISQPVKYMALYYCFELGYHLHSLMFHLYLPARNDFYETLLHHLVTVFLVVLSYINNCARIGVLVMVLHDIVDAIMYTAKSLNDISNDYVVIPAFSMLVIAYARFRLWVFPRYVISAAYNAKNFIPETATCGYLVWCMFLVLLVSLYGLHIYWFALIIDMIKKLVTNQGIVDPHATKKAVGQEN